MFPPFHMQKAPRGLVDKPASTFAKLSRPQLHVAIHRERLYGILDGGRSTTPALCVVGPPGAGKTTVVATWLDTRQVDGIWYQIDSGDADLASFFYYLGHAVLPFAQKDAPALPALTVEYLQDVRGFSRRFFRRVFESLPPGAVLVLDNYQEVPPTEPFHQIIADAVDEAPPGGCLIVISRRDLPGPYARLIVNERMTTVSWDDLRLTLEEAYAIGGTRGVRSLPELKRMHEEADGWSAGLTLLLEQYRVPVRSARQRKSEEILFDYFASQVFDVIETEVRSFLVMTALLPIIQIEVAEALTGMKRTATILEELYARRLFVHRRPGNPLSYQYHALFRDFLCERLIEQVTAVEFAELLRRAAELLRDNGQLEDAFALFCRAGAWPQAERLILDLAPALLAEGRWRTLQESLESLPKERIENSAWALYWFGLSRMHDSSILARDYLIRANRCFSRDEEIIGRLLSAAAIIRSYHFEYNTFEAMDTWIEQIEEGLEVVPEFRSPADELSVHTAVLLVVTYRLPAHVMRRTSLKRVADLLLEPIDVNQRISAAFVLLLAHTTAHENKPALQLIDRIAPLMDDASLSALNRAYWWMLVGYFQHRNGDRGKTEVALNRADQIASENGLPQPKFLSRCFRAQHCCSWSDITGAIRALDGLDQCLSEAKPMATAQYHKQRFFLEMARGDAAAAEWHARCGVTAAGRLGSPYFDVAWMSQGAAALAMNGACAEATQWLDAAWRLSGGGFLETYRPMILASKAYVALRLGKKDEGRTLLRELFAMAADADAFSYVGTVPVLKDVVLTEALAAGICVPLVQSLIRKYKVVPARSDLDDWPWPVRVYTLGAFLIQVNGQCVQYSRKTPRKVLLLLKALIAMGGKSVPQRRLVDALWPDEDGDAGVEALGTSLHRLRKLLGDAAAIEFTDGMLSIDRGRVWIDVWSMDDQIAGAGPALAGDPPDHRTQRILSLYRGHFLDEEADAPWAISRRETVRARFLSYLLTTGKRLEAAGDLDSAVGLYRTGLAVDELAESLCRGLMRSLNASGQAAEALIVYWRLCRVLAEILGIKPSVETQRLFEEIQRQNQLRPAGESVPNL